MSSAKGLCRGSLAVTSQCLEGECFLVGPAQQGGAGLRAERSLALKSIDLGSASRFSLVLQMRKLSKLPRTHKMPELESRLLMSQCTMLTNELS